VLKVERLNIVVIAGASLGVLLSAGLAPVSGLARWPALGLFAFCLAGAVASERGRARAERKLLAELQEHRAVFGSSSTAHLTIASAALELVECAERAVAESAAQVSQFRTQLDALKTGRNPIAPDATSSEFKSAFVTKVSHELRTPLAGIKAYVELLIDGEAPDEQTRQEFYQVIYGEADRLGRLVDDIVAVSRIEAGVARPARRAVGIRALVRSALVRVDSELRKKSVAVSHNASDCDYQTLGDPAMLEQALETLLLNAIKFSPTGGGINVGIVTDSQDKSVLITILDQGPKVEPQDVPGLFDKFDGARTCARTSGGAGIALALVRQIVEAVHGGSVLVESGPGRGCRFGMRLPVYEPQTSHADEMCIR
jgi:signal transduction histidine kinase